VRIVRAETMALKERGFVAGLKIGGLSDSRIIFRHVLPNVFGTIMTLAALEIGTMILAESALSFLGLGVVDPDISWGAELANGKDYLQIAWWLVTFPGIAISTTVLYVNLAGDALRSRYDLRKRMF
jgi:peptide/nickel transport system permease protein